MESRLSVDLDLRAEEATGRLIGSKGARYHDVACHTEDGERFDCEAFVKTSASSAARARYRVERASGDEWTARRVAGNPYFPARLTFPD